VGSFHFLSYLKYTGRRFKSGTAQIFPNFLISRRVKKIG
jgi:hypothetical protein